MSDDITGNQPPEGGEPERRDTNPILEQLVAEVRGMREDVRGMREELHEVREGLTALGVRVDGLAAELKDFKQEMRRELSSTRDAFHDALSLESRSIRVRLGAAEDHIKALDDEVRAKR